MFTATTLFIVISLFSCSEPQVTDIKALNWNYWPIRYADFSSKRNIFFDRVVSLILDVNNYKGYNATYRNFGLGVFIDQQRVLTSYNPFRQLSRFNNITGKIAVYFLTLRIKRSNTYTYEYEIYNITCGRQVAYLPDDEITEYQWHGKDRKHCPVHDLMVLKLKGQPKNFNSMKPQDYTYAKVYPSSLPVNSRVKAGPFLTELAKPGETLQKKIQFASIGYEDQNHMKVYRFLHVTEYDEADDLILNCDDWLPREWGHFICILNKDNFPGLGSGATLTSNYKLFGVGSFVMFREGISIFVFTDVRKYNSLIMNTCTKSDTT